MTIEQLLNHYRDNRNYARYVLNNRRIRRNGCYVERMKCAGKCGFTYDWSDNYFSRLSVMKLTVICKACEKSTQGATYQFCTVCPELKPRTIKNFRLKKARPRRYQRICKVCHSKTLP